MRDSIVFQKISLSCCYAPFPWLACYLLDKWNIIIFKCYAYFWIIVINQPVTPPPFNWLITGLEKGSSRIGGLYKQKGRTTVWANKCHFPYSSNFYFLFFTQGKIIIIQLPDRAQTFFPFVPEFLQKARTQMVHRSLVLSPHSSDAELSFINFLHRSDKGEEKRGEEGEGRTVGRTTNAYLKRFPLLDHVQAVHSQRP